MKTMGIGERLQQVRTRIEQAQRQSGRAPGSVCLVAVSKTQSADALIEAYRHRQRHFGENYLQEAIEKQSSLAHFRITWHFIGPVQSNKTRIIADRFSWVHSVDRLKIARRLNEQRPAELGPLNICVQINIDSESTKSGIALEKLPELAAQIADLPGLRFRGLMA
ncbi:MAG: YggS family pyridoxal phosphate-dependent enzyme, partial [Methylococcales bacterium]